MNVDLSEQIMIGAGVQEFLDHHDLEADFRIVCDPRSRIVSQMRCRSKQHCGRM